MSDKMFNLPTLCSEEEYALSECISALIELIVRNSNGKYCIVDLCFDSRNIDLPVSFWEEKIADPVFDETEVDYSIKFVYWYCDTDLRLQNAISVNVENNHALLAVISYDKDRNNFVISTLNKETVSLNRTNKTVLLSNQ